MTRGDFAAFVAEAIAHKIWHSCET